MLNGKTISLIIPCKNEEKAIADMLKKMPAYVDEVLVIDNNSTDSTPQVVKKFGATLLPEKRHQNGIGYGYAHQRGLKAATSDYIITMDGDNTYPLHEIKKVITFLEDNQYDFVSCNRFPLRNPHVISPIRQLGVWVLNREVRLLYGFPCKDILSGMWAMNRRTAKKLNLKSGDWNLSPEIKLAAYMHPQIRFAEQHITHKYRYDGRSKQQIWKTGFGHLFYILVRRFTIDNPLRIFIQNFNLGLEKISGSLLPSFSNE